MTRALRNALFSAVAASALAFALPLAAQTPHAIETQADEVQCLAQPAPACTAELALKAARDEPEGWAATAAFEAFIANDPDLAARDRWMARYEAWAQVATVDGIRDRIVPVRAEHLARKGDFADAYRELGLDKPQPDTLSEPSVLILDEARAGRVRDTLPRIERLVESESRDELRLEILEIALARAPADADAVEATIRDRFTRRMAQALRAGARGDPAISRSIDEWARGARARTRPRPSTMPTRPAAILGTWCCAAPLPRTISTASGRRWPPAPLSRRRPTRKAPAGYCAS
jgi:hypothetical protein